MRRQSPQASADPAPMYDAFAPYYDLWTTMAAGTRHDIGFYVGLAAQLAPEAEIVELGVGTGRVALAVAATGRRVTGVDNSPAMLEKARAKARAAGVEPLMVLVCAEFLAWSPPPGTADLIYCPYHTLGHLLAPSDRKALFQSVFCALRPGGRFAFTIHGRAFSQGLRHGHLADRDSVPFTPMGELDVDGARVSVEHREIFDPTDQVAYTEVRSRAETGGDVVRERAWAFAAAVPERQEVEALARDLGFVVERLSGAFDRQVEPIDEQVWTLRKPLGIGAGG
ncbi:class I SAM-dependent DNA methyltransferase [Phenylobacterium sp.]|uniref:class I SAM-dependent DNA methyltransferase n=1 Tax=Phenylobacterium sp. TaxID=1871053 RepID=UPI003BAD8E3A